MLGIVLVTETVTHAARQRAAGRDVPRRTVTTVMPGDARKSLKRLAMPPIDPETENPGVGGSIPSLPTMFCSHGEDERTITTLTLGMKGGGHS